MHFSLKKKLALSAVLFAGLLFGVTGAVFAQGIKTPQQLEGRLNSKSETFVKEVTEGEKTSGNITNTTTKITETNLNYFVNLIYGCPASVASDCATSSLLPGGGTAALIPSTGNMIAFTYKKPASVDYYVSDLAQNFGIVQPAYAQGLGFASLQPLLELWKIFRNIAYVFFVIIFLIIGFAIMFRQNLGGQAAVTIQQALPRIIVALLAVTFSYAIAGLLIDIMYLIMYFLIAVFAQSGLLNTEYISPSGSQFILNKNIFAIYVDFMSGGGLEDSFHVVESVVSNFLSGSVGNWVNGAFSDVAGVLGMLIIGVALVFAMFRTFFSLIKVYMEILLSIVFSPLILMLGAINGNAFGNWLKSLFINLMVFPALLVFMLIGTMLVSGNYSTSGRAIANDLSGAGFVPPFLPGGGQANAVGLIAGLATIMLLPEVAGLMAKYKPASVWDDLGVKAINNIMTGNQLAAPLTFGAGSAALETLRGGFSGFAQNRTLGGTLSGALFGQEVGDKKYGGTFRGFGRGFRAGRTVARTIDRAKSGELIDPSVTASQFDQVIQKIDKVQAKDGKDDAKTSGSTGTGYTS